MAAARAYWRGQIKLALVSIPVEVFPATRSGAAISFHQVHEPSGKRIRYEKVAPGVGPVDKDEIMKGYEVSKGSYVLLDDAEIDMLYYEKPYYVVPADDLAEEAYVVLRDALRQAKKVGLGQLSVRGREQLVSIKPCGRGLVMEVLRYADEVRKAQGFFRDIGDTKPEPDLLDLATTLIDKKTAPFDPAEFHDRYVEALQGLIEKKRKTKGGERILEDVEEPGRSGGGNVIDLMAALRKSVGESPRKAASKSKSSRSTATKRTSRKSA